MKIRKADWFSAPGIPPTLIPSKPVRNPKGRKIAAPAGVSVKN